LRTTSEDIESGCYGDAPTCLGYIKTPNGKYRTKYSHKKFWLTYSSRKPEKPMNIVVPRATLESLPHSRHFIVTKGKVVKA
jgi:hypothetical protein